MSTPARMPCMAHGWQAFTALVKPGGHILDAGCGSGRDALAFHRAGFRVTATEASANLAALARVHTGLPIDVLIFDQMEWRDTFDGVWTCASLLHVPRAEIRNVLRRLGRALRPSGWLFVSLWKGKGEGLLLRS